MNVFVGYDSREDIAYQVCKYSIISRSKGVNVIPLVQEDLRDQQIYTRPVDALSSTEFTFTRFLVPYLSDYQGWAIFCDCDFLFLEDITKLFEVAYRKENQQFAVMCVHHEYEPKNSTKMDNQTQHNYPRKNWSSLVLFNCQHPSNKQLTPDVVNTETGAFLHRFQWLKDEEIGTIHHEWNWLVNWYHEPKDGSPKGLHYTEGGPWFTNYFKCEYGAHWLQEKNNYLEYTKPVTVSESYESTPVEVKDIFDSIINYRVDPTGAYYDVTLKTLVEKIKKLKVDSIISVNSDIKEVKFLEKGHMYDPILQNFVLGAGGQISTWDVAEKLNTPVLLRGITKRKQMKDCQEKGRDFYYIDTGYFGNGRKKLYHRVTKNSMQNIGSVIDRPGDRFEATGVRLTKFRPGSSILLCPPSAKAMAFFELDLDEWLKTTIDTLKQYTDRPIITRIKKGRAERVTTDTMEMALSQDIHCLVTFNSIAATEALLLGKPAFTLGPNAAQSLCLSDLSKIEKPYIPTLDEVHRWACHLAYAQFTVDEMRSGIAWSIVSET
jgi:lipopolysaccharide biosynthesis glycosyltransferase